LSATRGVPPKMAVNVDRIVHDPNASVTPSVTSVVKSGRPGLSVAGIGALLPL
jgi:hypothetical protein